MASKCHKSIKYKYGTQALRGKTLMKKLLLLSRRSLPQDWQGLMSFSLFVCRYARGVDCALTERRRVTYPPHASSNRLIKARPAADVAGTGSMGAATTA